MLKLCQASGSVIVTLDIFSVLVLNMADINASFVTLILSSSCWKCLIGLLIELFGNYTAIE